MKHLCYSALLVAAVAFAPATASAQTKGSTATQPGASANAPGQKAQSTDQPAKTFAPGQQEKVKDKDKMLGANEYAPGQKTK